jgi:signal transduction histidine kinase
LKRIFSFILVSSFVLSGYCRGNLDSAKLVLSKSTDFTTTLLTLEFLSNKCDDPLEIIKFSNQALKILDGLDSVQMQIGVMQNIGFAYNQLGDYTTATEYFYRSADLANQQGYRLEEAQSLANLASTFNIIGNYARSIPILQRGLAIGIEMQDTATIHPTLINLGNAYYYAGQLDSSLFYLAESIRHAVGQPYEGYYNAYSKGTAALVYAKLDNLDTAFYLLERSTVTWTSYEDYYPIAECLVEISQILLDNKSYSSAYQYGIKGFTLATEKSFLKQQREGANTLFQYHKQTGNFDSALFYQTVYYQVKDSIENVEVVKKVEAERANFEISKKQTEVDLLNTQKKGREQVLLGLVIIVLLLLTVAVLIYRNLSIQSKLRKELESQKQVLEKLNTSKDKLFSIVSHDLRGPIAAFAGVSNMIKIAVKHQKTEMLDEIADEVKNSSTRLSAMLENLLNWAMQEQGAMSIKPEEILLEEIFQELEGIYISVAATKQIEFSFDRHGIDSITVDKNALHTILRNLINNAMKFTKNNGKVAVSAQSTGSVIEISVSDTGIGIPPEKLNNLFQFSGEKSTFGTLGEKGLGLGLNLVYEFTQAIGGHIKVISEQQKGTTFTLSIASKL